MKMLKRLCAPYLRFRHTRGFGIHSPYAYRFVTDVLRPGDYGYYAFERLCHLGNLSPKNEAEARKIVRLLIFLKAQKVVTDSFMPSVSAAAFALNIPCITIQEGKDYCFAEGDVLFTTRKGTAGILKRGRTIPGAIMAVNPHQELLDIITQPRDHGLLLNGKRNILLIPRKDMAYVCYEINL